MRLSESVYCILFLIFGMHAAYAMEAAPLRPKAYIENKTNDKIVVQYQVNQERPVSVTISPEDSYNLGDRDVLQLLNVSIYGAYKQWLSAHKLTGGMWGLKNLNPLIREQDPTKNVMLSVESWPSVAGKVLPYTYIVKPIENIKEFEKVRTVIWDVFTQAKAAKEAGSKIEPRYILNLPANASRDEIIAQYSKLRNEWTAKQRAARPGNTLPKDALQFIEAAYKALIAQADFDDLVAGEVDAPTLYLGEYKM